MKPIFTDAMAGPEIRRALNDMAGQFEQAVQEAVGPKGWSPVIIAQASGAGRVVLRVTDWTGGEGEKPAATGYIGPAGLVDDAAEAVNIMGAPGAKGQDGQDGAPGQDGADGPANTLSIGTVQAGDAAAASLTGDAPAQTLNLVLPRGPAGINGEDGADGQDGQAATITIGQVTTLPPGQSATVVNSGTANAAVLDFALPAGRDGSGAVISVNGKDGAVVLAAGDIEGLATIATTGQWADLQGKPAALAAGDTPEQARAAIGAGTSNLTLGDGADQAKPGDWQPVWDAVQGKPAIIAAGDTQQAAREAIGAGTSSLELGSTAHQAKPGNWQPGWDEVTGKPAVLAAGDSAEAARAAIGAGTSSLPDAPSDGQSYARRNGQWTPAGAGGGVPIGAAIWMPGDGEDFITTPGGEVYQRMHLTAPYSDAHHNADALHWSQKFMASNHTMPTQPQNDFKFIVASDAHVFALTARGETFRSSDDGQTWQRQGGDITDAGVLSSVCATPEGELYACGSLISNQYKGDIWRSTDGGASWARIPTNGYNFAKAGLCYAHGFVWCSLVGGDLLKFQGENMIQTPRLPGFSVGSQVAPSLRAHPDGLLICGTAERSGPMGVFNIQTRRWGPHSAQDAHTACMVGAHIFYINYSGKLFRTTDYRQPGEEIAIGTPGYKTPLAALGDTLFVAGGGNSSNGYSMFKIDHALQQDRFLYGGSQAHGLCVKGGQVLLLYSRSVGIVRGTAQYIQARTGGGYFSHIRTK